jgi:CheY-like chemotaxis protein
MSPKLEFDVIPLGEVPVEGPRGDSESQPVVLVVDDEKVIADTLSIILRKSGFSTLTAYDGPTALRLASDLKPDLVISDVMMPGMTGIELAISVTRTIPKCKILLFSGQAATVDLLEKARSAGYDFITLTKPVHPTDMLKRISECLVPSAKTPPSILPSTGSRHQFAGPLPN